MNSAKRMNWDIGMTLMTEMLPGRREPPSGPWPPYAVAFFGTWPTLMTNRFRSAR